MNKIKKHGLYFFIFSLLSLSILSILAPLQPLVSAKASAPPSKETIQTNQALYKNNLAYIAQNCKDFQRNDATWDKCTASENVLNKNLGCSDRMFVQKVDPNDTSVKLDSWFVNSSSFKECYSEADAILASINGSKCKNMKKLGTGDDGYDSSAWKLCQDWQNKLNLTLGCSKTMFEPASQSGYFTQDASDVTACQRIIDVTGNIRITTADGQENQTVAATAPTGGVSGDPTSNVDKLSCDYSSSMLSWIVCPFIDGLVLFIGIADGIITDLLEVDTQKIFCDSGDTCQAYYKAWQSFRNIALGLMVIAGLIIVISTAIGIEILDAYTIRRTLPRLLVAAIGITLSWPLMQFLVTLSNDLGFGIRTLIYAPFNSLQDQIDLTFGENIATTFFAAAGLYTIGIFGVLSYALTAILAVFVAVLVLVLRQIAIILMITLAPIAIVCYILPNTQKVYKLWWESFSKALLMFPMIAAFIASGRVFSAIALQGDGPISQLIGFIAYFAPYFLIPMTFKFAGSAVGQLGGFVNDRSRGGFDRLSKFRAGQTQKNLASMKSGTRMEAKKWIPGHTKASKYFNETTKGLGTGWKGRYGLGKGGKIARSFVDQAAADELLKSPGMQAIKGKNDWNRILAEGMGDENRGRKSLRNYLKAGGDDGEPGSISEEEITRRVDTASLAAKRAGGFTKAHGIAAFKNMARDGTAIRNTDDLARLAAVVGDGDENNTFTFAAEAASISRQVNRPDLAAATDPIGELAFAHSQRLYGNNMFTNASVHDDAAVRPESFTGSEADMERLQFKAWQSGSGGEIAWTKFGSAKGRAIRKDTEFASHVLKNETGTYTDEQREIAATYLRETEMAIEQGTGKQNNRNDARAILERGDVAAAYKSYMEEEIAPAQPQAGPPRPGMPDGSRTTKRKDRIGKIVGDRLANMPEAERLKLAQGEQPGDQEG